MWGKKRQLNKSNNFATAKDLETDVRRLRLVCCFSDRLVVLFLFFSFLKGAFSLLFLMPYTQGLVECK